MLLSRSRGSRPVVPGSTVRLPARVAPRLPVPRFRPARRYTSLTQEYQFPKYLLNTPDTKVTTLKNGFTIATEESPSETCSVGVFINAGTAFEEKHNNGVAHFLEHLAFKGTKRRTQQSLELEVENIGGHLNAYTSREHTVYYARCFKNDLPQAVDILSDILQNSQISDESIERERDVILREMQEVESTTEEVIFEHLHSIAYQETSHALSILGPEENIKSLKRNDMLDYIKTHYTAPRMVLAAAGRVNHDELVRLAEEKFGGLSAEVHGQAALTPAFTGSMVTIRNDEMPLAHVAVAFEGVGYSDPDYFVFLVMQTLLGSWDRNIGGGKNLISPLSETISHEGLAHSYMAFHTPYNKTGLFGVYATGPGDKLDHLSHAMLYEITRLAHGTTSAEVERARNKLKATTLMVLDNSSAVCEDIGRQLLTLSRRLTPAEIFMRIDMINADEVKRVAQEYLWDNEIAVAAMGPTVNLPDYNVLRGWTYWNRV